MGNTTFSDYLGAIFAGTWEGMLIATAVGALLGFLIKSDERRVGAITGAVLPHVVFGGLVIAVWVFSHDVWGNSYW